MERKGVKREEKEERRADGETVILRRRKRGRIRRRWVGMRGREKTRKKQRLRD